MTLPAAEIPDLPELPRAPRVPARSATAVVVDGDTGEIMLPPAEELRRATEIVATQGGLVAQVAEQTRGVSIVTASPEARAALVDFYLALADLAFELNSRAKAIEYAWSIGMREMGATRLPLPDGRSVEMIQPPKSYRVDGPELRSDLERFVEAGLVSAEDADAAVAVIVSYKPDHRVLNKLERHAPTEVRESIAAHRTEVPTLAGGRVQFPKPRA